MADAESMMVLQLGVELEIFRHEEAESLLRKQAKRFRSAADYALSIGPPQVFERELQMFLIGLRKPQPCFMDYPEKLSPELFESGTVEILFHEVGREFRSGLLTTALSFLSSQDWKKRLAGKLDPDRILSKKPLTGINELVSRYFDFLGHAASLNELWQYVQTTAESTYAARELKWRIRAVHGWRLDLHHTETRERFESLTALVAYAVVADDELARLGFKTDELISYIQALCRSWAGDDDMTINVPFDSRRFNMMARAS